MAEIKDSGERYEFETGAVRDIQKGKGRCDLMPLDIIAEVLGYSGDIKSCLENINAFIETKDKTFLIKSLYDFIEFNYGNSREGYLKAVIELSKHFEEGAGKYGEGNWKKGIPVHCYIDSGVRHFLKCAAGETDEPHGRAFMWNIVCCIWTLEHKPEMNDMKGTENK